MKIIKASQIYICASLSRLQCSLFGKGLEHVPVIGYRGLETVAGDVDEDGQEEGRRLVHCVAEAVLHNPQELED